MMLFDQVQAYDTSHYPEPYKAEIELLKKNVAKAEHFVLDSSMAMAADALSRDEVIKAAPICRVPFKSTWIEACHADRPKFNQKPIGEGLIRPKRVGLLVEEATDLLPDIYDLTLVWDCPGKADSINVCAVSAVADLSGGKNPPATMNKIDIGLAGNGTSPPLPFVFTATRRYSGESMGAIAQHDPELAAAVLGQCVGDWAGEPWFWMSVLALLNARNGASVTKGEDRTKLNRARAKSGKRPLADFHVLTVRLSKAERAAQREGACDHEGKRAHVVRGHFKVRKSGMYWWRPFVRGDLGKGFANKRYDLTAGAERR